MSAIIVRYMLKLTFFTLKTWDKGTKTDILSQILWKLWGTADLDCLIQAALEYPTTNSRNGNKEVLNRLLFRAKTFVQGFWSGIHLIF